MLNEVLEIADIPFTVTAQIQRAPHWTMIRELTMNAIEAASQASGEKIVHWTSRQIDGVRKAVIWNTGPGMNAAQLKAATYLACRIDKSLGIDENFGIGAKVSSLASNQNGMRFRSCKDGKVSEVILGYDPSLKRYVRFVRELENGAWRDSVIDVTFLAATEGYDLSTEWTEVALYGNSDNQDTVARPIASMNTDKGFIATTLYRRFYRLPEGVKLKLDDSYHRLANTRLLMPVGQRYDRFARTETVEVSALNFKVHFLHDPVLGDKSGLRLSSRGALASSTTTCCLVHKSEMYSVMTGTEWAAAAPHFGIPFGSKELCVHIELADEEARPSQYRERLISRENAADINPLDYASFVREIMPDWVKEIIRNASPRKTEDFSDIRRDLQELLNKYKVKVLGRKIDSDAGEPSEAKNGQEISIGTSNGGDRHERMREASSSGIRRFRKAPEGATTTSLYEVFERPPKFYMLTEEEDIASRGLKGRAAMFFIDTGDLFVNGLYEAVTRSLDDVEPEFTGQADAETIRDLTLSAARHALAYRVGKAVVFALAKRANEDWDPQALAAAITKESLSIAADNYLESLNAIKKRVRDGIKVARLAA
jgi:hypothetical protein